MPRPNRLPPVRRKRFWIFQLIGWAAWVMMLVLRDIVFIPPEYILPRALVFSCSALLAVLLTSGLRYLYHFVWEQGLLVRFLVTWFGSLGAATIWQPFRNYIALLPFGETIDFGNASADDLFDGLFSNSFPIMLVWSGIYFIFKYYQLFQEEKEKSLRSEALAHEAQLLMLRYQLNPHFLFNTLNAISTLVLAKRNRQANEMLTKLSKFLRYSLDHSPFDRVSLTHELTTSQLYLEIEKVRFGERLTLDVNIDREVGDALVPTMLLQPIIENSIKHGISKSETGGTITISAWKEERHLILEVTDDGPGLASIDPAQNELSLSTGVGVSNIRNRLLEIYGKDHELSFHNARPHGLTVKVKIPYDID